MAADLAVKSFWDFSVGELNAPGEILDMKEVKGQVVLCVNVASF